MDADHRSTARAGRRAGAPGTARRRRVAALAGTGLLATALSVVGAAPPAAAAVECTSEAPPNEVPVLGGFVDPACDDQHPPETTLASMTPAANAAGWIREDDVVLTFSGAYQAVDDTDTDPIVFECRLTGPSQQHDWRSCTSPVTYTDLADSGTSAAYTFDVRAVDEADAALTVTRTIAGTGEDETVEDVDATPATTSWRVDTVAPNVLLASTPVDTVTPDLPVVVSRRASFLARSSDRTASLVCRLDGAAVPCSQGTFQLTGLSTGTHELTIQAQDAAGNAGNVETTGFTVAKDLADGDVRRSGWRTVADAAALDGDLVRPGRRGVVLTVPLDGPVTELRLYVPSRAAGVVRMRVGDNSWRRVDLDRDTRDDGTLAVVRRSGDPLSGDLQIMAVERPRRILLDAVLAR